MQTTEQPVFSYAYAKKLADRAVELLQPHCERIEIAGSIRREAMFVKDTELCVIPTKVFEPTDLFGGGVWKVCPEFILAIDQMKEEVVKGKPSGRYMQIILKGGIKLDLFMPVVEDYIRQFVIRTGSADFSHKIIATAWLRGGWCAVPGIGLRLQKNCVAVKDNNGKGSWKLVNDNNELPPIWQSEHEFFEWLKVSWVAPKNR